MNQRFLTNFSLVVIKYCEGDASFSMGNASFLRSEIFLSSNKNESSFQNYLFYAETQAVNNYDFKVTIEFHQEVLFRHRLSNKYLAYLVQYQDEQNDSIVKLHLSDKPCFFRIAPCFQYQTKISPRVKFNEDVYLATELNSTKQGFVAVEAGDHGDHLRTLLSLNERSKLILHAYCELEKEERGYVYGQAVWLKHVECNSFATVVKPQGEQNVMFEAIDMEDSFQSINGLWLIESTKIQNGGSLNYGEPIYFKSLCTQKYLSFSKVVKVEGGEKVYSPVLLERPNEHCRFMFESLKGEQSKIRKGAYLKLRHCFTGAYLGGRNHSKADSLFRFPLLTFAEFEDEDLFDLIELKLSDEQAMRFIFSVKRELEFIDGTLSKEVSRKTIGEIQSLYRNILSEMGKLTGFEMFQQVQEELGPSISSFCRHLQLIRKKAGQGEGGQLGQLVKSIYQILSMICRNCKDNQFIAYGFLQCFVEDVFNDCGTEDLLSQLFRNNYSLLCKLPNPLKELKGRNLINSIFTKVTNHPQKTGTYWARVLKLLELLEVVLNNRGETIDINQRLIATELFQEDRFSKIFFEVRVFKQRIRMLHPQHRRWVEIELLTEPQLLRVLQGIFNLLAKICENRNFVSKRYVDNYLNATNEEGAQTVISYLNISISPALTNSLFALVTNCYIDSSPRIDRHKPLAVLNFSFPEHPLPSEPSEPLLNEPLLDRSQPLQLALNGVWKISNMLEGMASNEPGLKELEFDLYKEELEVRLREGEWSQELLRCLCILIRLESFTARQLQQLFKTLSSTLLEDKPTGGIVVSIMEIFQELTTHVLELELKKITAFLKYRFSSSKEFSPNDVKRYLSRSPIPSFSISAQQSLPSNSYQAVSESQLLRQYRKEYNELIRMIETITPTLSMKESLLQMFVQSPPETPFSVLSSVFKTMLEFSRPILRVTKLVGRCIVLTGQEMEGFEETFRFYKKVRHLTSIAEHWLAPNADPAPAKEFCHLVLQFTNFLFEDYTLNSHNDRRFRAHSRLNINRQLLVLNLHVHNDILDLLNSNFYLLENRERHQLPPKLKEVFQSVFQFLLYFTRACPQTTEAVTQRLDAVQRFNALAEVGQTRLLIQLYRETPHLAKQVRLPLVQTVLTKIIRGPLSAQHDKPCEFNPEYLQFLNTACCSNGKVYRKNLEMIFRALEKEGVLRRVMFTEGKGLALNPSSFGSAPLQVPILYHRQLLKLVGLLLKHLEYSGSAIKAKVKEIIDVETLLRMLALPDIYSHRGVVPELYFLLKKEAMPLLHLFLDKTDSLILLAESEALAGLLDHYLRIFLQGREPIVLPCPNEVQFLPWVDSHAEVKYDLSNQRDYYSTHIEPLLNRLLLLFEKYGKRSSSNYLRLTTLLERVSVKDLPQDHLLRHEAHGIDLVRLKWRNFIDADQENSPEEKFVKQTLLELLRHPASYELLKEEQEAFFKRIKLKEQGYFAVMSRLVAEASEEGQAEQTQPNRLFFQELIANLAQYLVWSSGQAQRRGWEGGQLAETLLGYVTREDFEFSDPTSRNTFYHIIKILVFLLQHDAGGVLLRDFYHLLTRPSSFRFFNHLREAVGEVSDRIVGDLAHEQINEALGQLYIVGEERRCEMDREALRFLRLLCSHTPFTELLRSQSFNTSTDFLDKIYNTFYFLVKRSATAPLTLNVAVVDITEDLLQTVQALLNGCNLSNQNYVIDNKFPQIVVQALKMDTIPEQRSLGELARRDRLIEQVCAFYLANGIDVGPLIAEKLTLMDFQHPYLLNRFKYSLLKLALQTVLANERGLSKLRLLLPIQLLKINLIWIYEDFKAEGGEWGQNTVLRRREDWGTVVRQTGGETGLSRMFLMIGFFFFQLIQHSNQAEEAGEDEAQTSASEEKEKQKLVKKFFSSISEKHKNEEKLHSLDNHPFAEQMKLFYNKYYEAYDFFEKRTATIEAQVFGHLVRLYFPVIPLCHKITEPMKERLLEEAERISHEEKVKSLMAFEQENFDFLQGEEDYFAQMRKKSQLAGRVAQLVENQQNIYLFVWFMSVLIVLGYLLDDFANPSSNFAQSFANYLSPSTVAGIFILVCSLVNLGCGFLLLLNLIIRKVPFLSRLYQYKYEKELEEEGEMEQSLRVYQASHVLSASFFDLYSILFSILTILHPLFAGFLLVYIVKRIELGKTIVRAIEETWFSLFVAAALLIVFNYIFSILIYCASFTYDVGYGTTCKTLFTCLLMLVDQSLKAGSGFLATNTSDFTNMTLSFKVIAEIMYILFAQKVIFEIFSGTIIDKFGELREEGDSTKLDEESTCFICGQQRFQIDFELQGFQIHVEKTHNKLNYIYYLFYLRRKDRGEYGIEDAFIWEAHQKANYDWIPDDTSIEKERKVREKKKEADEEKFIEEYEKYYQKKLQELKKMHSKVEVLSGLLKEDNFLH